jgi:hypothetical protein
MQSSIPGALRDSGSAQTRPHELFKRHRSVLASDRGDLQVWRGGFVSHRFTKSPHDRILPRDARPQDFDLEGSEVARPEEPNLIR